VTTRGSLWGRCVSISQRLCDWLILGAIPVLDPSSAAFLFLMVERNGSKNGANFGKAKLEGIAASNLRITVPCGATMIPAFSIGRARRCDHRRDAWCLHDPRANSRPLAVSTTCMKFTCCSSVVVLFALLLFFAGKNHHADVPQKWR